MDLMAIPASVHKKWVEGRGKQELLPLYCRYRTQSCAGTDVLLQNVKFMPVASVECFGFCFPPTNMVGVMLQHLEECQARAVIIVPDQKQPWGPRLARALVKCRTLPTPTGPSRFFACTIIEGKNHSGLRSRTSRPPVGRAASMSGMGAAV